MRFSAASGQVASLFRLARASTNPTTARATPTRRASPKARTIAWRTADSDVGVRHGQLPVADILRG